MMRFLAAALVVWVQTAPAQVPAFEVASVKRVPSDGLKKPGRESIQVVPDGVILRNASLRSAIRWAYRVFDQQISGPDWIGVERYDISAKAAGTVPEERLRLMLQGLLTDRLKLSLHRVNKEQSVFVLTVGRNGPKFSESQGEGEMKVEPDLSKFTVRAQRVPISQGVEILTNLLKAPVIDMTGLTGKYDATVSVSKYVPEPGTTAATFDVISTIMTGIQEELGLKLESKRMPLELLVIDHAEKSPTEN